MKNTVLFFAFIVLMNISCGTDTAQSAGTFPDISSYASINEFVKLEDTFRRWEAGVEAELRAGKSYVYGPDAEREVLAGLVEKYPGFFLEKLRKSMFVVVILWKSEWQKERPGRSDGKSVAVALQDEQREWIAILEKKTVFSGRPRGETPILIVSYGREHVVLRSTAAGIAWAAETGDSEGNEVVDGKDRTKGSVPGVIDLADVFVRVASIKDDTPVRDDSWWLGAHPGGLPSPRVTTWRPRGSGYSLMYLDSEGVKARDNLTSEQEKKLRDLMGTVFDDVLTKGPFYRSHLIRVRLASEKQRATMQFGAFIDRNPATEKPTAETAREMIGKTEKDLLTRFTRPDDVGVYDYYDFKQPDWEKNPARILVYGEVGVLVNIYGKIVGVKTP